ncbi:MAG: 2-C-methyl-D-erythritol 4-phosphate cytidylyltransferase, partial [Chloroflexota bacterium]|nr:2-C-methyl-D-erythritol 4-phosphate cytidylyltransferase [Chloroflexota bacterium]
IVVAAGRSARMGGADKLAAEIDGRPLLAWSLAALTAAPEVARVVVVTTHDRRAEVAAADWLPSQVIDVVAGGERRQGSVHAGFIAFDRHGADEAGVVLVHDAARPLVEPSLIAAVAEATARFGAAIPIVPVAETLKRIDGGLVGATVDRSGLGAAQTPQGARRALLREAYRRFPADGQRTFTDEAALLEACSITVHVVEGDPGNLKVTLPGDLRRVAAALTGLRGPRTGIGHDSHPFGPEMPLLLGGVEIAGAPRLAGHSDGDVVLHAVADALLGAAALGDLGRLFPADAQTPRGIASTRLLEQVLRRIETAGYRPRSVDLTIVAARPRLGAHLDPIRDAIADLLRLDRGSINVKASSGNLDGAEGAGRSISALVVATVEALR